MDFNLQELKTKSIFEIRNLAKEIGVSSPTKLKKDELIDMIVKISSGEISAPEAPRRGRPKKAKAAETSATETQREELRGDGHKKSTEEKTESTSVVRLDKSDKADEHRGEPRFQPYTKQRTFDREGQKRTSFAERRYEEDLALADQVREGYLEIYPDGYGFLRVKMGEFSDMDAYVGTPKIRQYGLRRGDHVKAACKVVQDGKPLAVVQVQQVNGIDADKVEYRKNFDDLIPIYPKERVYLEVPNQPRDYATRCIDLVAPIGKGQRGMIVSPPKAGKTTLLKMIANSIKTNYPDIVLMILLIDERPEEVTDMKNSIRLSADDSITYSTFDELPEHHTKTAEMLLDRAKRLVESGKDVVVLLDSLTRLARAYNLTIPPTGRTLSGGIDPGALHLPKRFFGSARNIQDGASLTIIATALVETGSRMDDVIYEEFKGTGNMEIHLDRRLQEKRIFPAIDLAKSGTRKEELIMTSRELEGTWAVRKILSVGDSVEATENLLNMLVKTQTNKDFLQQISMQLQNWQKEGYTIRKPINGV